MKKILASLVVSLFVASPALAAEMEISDAFMRASPTPRVAGGFFTIHNPNDSDDKLVGVTSDISSKVELHTVKMEGDVARMIPITSVVLPAKGTAELKPGGNHVMFFNLPGPLEEGQTAKATLMFEKAPPQTIMIPVRGIAAKSSK